jgi:pyrroline-5-carboxylate reductase
MRIEQNAGESVMKVGFVGVGAMGEPMAGHVLKSKKFDEVWVYDINKAATKGIAKQAPRSPSRLNSSPPPATSSSSWSVSIIK